jgi:putative ABC transport system ATP-binding protein
MPMESSFIRTLDLCRYYRRGDYEVRALDKVSLTIDRGEFVAVVGASGSGKSTLLALLAGLDTPTSGQIEIGGRHLAGMSRKELAAYRAGRVGMVFQSFNLIPHRTALQNVELALFFDGTSRKERTSRARATLEKLNLGGRLDHRPADLSGGEQQRVAIARALVKSPDILFADEPTGNLDYEHAHQIADILTDLNRQGITVIMVTHDREMAGRCTQRLVRLVYGHVTEDTAR